MAGLIPQSFIDNLLDRADIVDVIDRRVKLKKSGKNYMACCPFHQEKTPSFSVNAEKQFYYCFGCGAGGNALGFLMDYENLEFPAAVEMLADSLGMEVPREQGGEREERGQRDLYPLMEQAANYYQRQLREHPRKATAVDYLKGRGLTGEIAKRFDLGFAPPGWDNLLKALGTSEERKQQLKLTGMLVENEESGRVYDRFRDRIVFPIRDQRGRVIGFGGRVLGDDKPKYLNSPETPIYHKGRELYGLYQARKANRTLERIIIVEGYMDVIALAQYGVSNATATLGTATGQAHLEKIYRLCPEVVFCFDGDSAGRQAAARALEAALPCMQDGRSARFLFLPEGEDPDTLVRSKGTDHFNTLVEQATPLDRFLFESLSDNLDTGSLDGKARLSKLAAPLIQRIPPGVFRELMFKELAERTSMEVDALTRIVDPAPAATPAAETSRPRQREPLERPTSGPNGLVQTAIFLLLHQPAIARHVADVEPLRVLEGEDAELLVELLELLKRHPESTTHMLLGHWYGTPQGELLNRLASQERLIPAEGIESEFSDTINELMHHPQRQNFDEQVDKLKHRNYAEISELEKLEIVQALRDKRRQDEERGRKR